MRSKKVFLIINRDGNTKSLHAIQTFEIVHDCKSKKQNMIVTVEVIETLENLKSYLKTYFKMNLCDLDLKS